MFVAGTSLQGQISGDVIICVPKHWKVLPVKFGGSVTGCVTNSFHKTTPLALYTV